MTLHTYNPQPMSQPSINFLHLTGFQAVAWTRFLKVKVTTARSNQGHIMILHTCNPQTNVPTKYNVTTLYGFQDIAWILFLNSRSLRQGQRSNQGQTMTLHTYTTLPMSLPSINILHLMIYEIQPGHKLLGSEALFIYTHTLNLKVYINYFHI